MSMLTEQCAKLRKTAYEVEKLTRDSLMLADAARQMREAADTITDLRLRLTEQTCRNSDSSGYGFKCSWCGHTRTLSDEIDPTEWEYCPSCGRRIVG